MLPLKDYDRSPLPHVRGFPALGVLSASPTPALTSRPPCFMGLLVGTHPVGQGGSPAFTHYLLVSMPSVQTPEARTALTKMHCLYGLPPAHMEVGNLTNPEYRG